MDFAAEASTTITSARARRASAGRRQSQAGIQRTGRTSPHRTSLAPQRWIPHGGSGQVYVVSAGKVYHPAWCNSVGNVWDENPKRLLVFEENTVGTRKACDEPFSPERQLYAVELLWPAASRSFLAWCLASKGRTCAAPAAASGADVPTSVHLVAACLYSAVSTRCSPGVAW